MSNRLLYIALLLFSNCFSQIGVISFQQKSSNGANDTIIPIPDQNMEYEVGYFDAYYLPISEKTNLQSALDTYGSVRLDKGDYSGTAIVITSNQRLYGHPSMTTVPSIAIAANSSNVLLESISAKDYGNIYFQAGGKITSCLFKNIRDSEFSTIGGQIEDNLFVNVRTKFNIDNSSSGYFRNNNITLHQVQSWSNQLIMKGNSTTPSFGNVHVWTNHLTPHGDATDFDNLTSATFLGLDAEGWNLEGGSKALIYMRNMGDVKISNFGGANHYSGVRTPSFDIQANTIGFMNKGIFPMPNKGIVRGNADVYSVFNYDDDYTFADTGLNLELHSNLSTNVELDNVNLTSTITDPTIISNLTNIIKGTEHTPYPKPVFETLPNPTGETWDTDRIGKPDSTSYIQGLINTNGIAELPEGIFYIASSLIIQNNEGIIGSGTGKTAIVGLNDDFPLIMADDVGSFNVVLSNMTLQGGSAGLSIPTTAYQLTASRFKFLVFRNQNYGIHLDRCYGVDNNFFDNVSFVDCNIGFFQDPDPAHESTPGGDRYDDTAYVDKVMFYRSQVINCGIGFSMLADRADNLNAWVDCLFDGNGQAAVLSGHNYPMFVNCDFTNHTDSSVIDTNSMTMFHSCDFYNNNTDDIFDAKMFMVEGCNFLDNINLNSFDQPYETYGYIINSTVTGNLGQITDGMFINSNLIAHPILSKLLVNIQRPGGSWVGVDIGTPTVLIDSEPDPYPQFLVKH